MIKTLKGKVVAGTVAVTLFAGAGVAFGASDAGLKLQSWYNSQFGKSTGQIVSNVEADVKGRINGLATEYEGLKTGATNSINSTKTTASSEKSTAIDAKAQEHINAINKKESQISGYMTIQFDLLSATANGLINQAGKTATDYANSDLTKHTGDKGTAALGELNTELAAATKTASDELAAEIASAKTALQAQLDSETAATTAEIKAKIDAKIIELRTTITAKRDELVSAQQTLITNKANELEAAALLQLQSLVDGI